MERPTPLDPTRLTRGGGLLYASAIIAFGVQILLTSKPPQGLEPLPPWLPARLLWTDLSGLILLGTGIGLLVRQTRRHAAYALGATLLLWIVLLQVPLLVATPRNGGVWTSAFEVLGLFGAAWILAGPPGGTPGRSPGMTRVGQLCYGLSLPAFGVLHILYAAYVASVIPAWIPGHIFWTYFVAAAFFAAGASLVSGLKARLAAVWTGIMFLSWVLMVHLPRVAVHPEVRAEWTSLLVALAMGGAAWLVAQTVADEPVRVTPAV